MPKNRKTYNFSVSETDSGKKIFSLSAPSRGLIAAAVGVVLLVVAGRHPYHAVGMETGQVVKVMQALGCTDAALLDGGSNVSLYWAPEGGTGELLNYPPDNHLVDHEGARPVSSVLVLVRP